MRIVQAGADDVPVLARLVLWNHREGEPSEEPVDAFATELAQWWEAHRDSHVAFLARMPDREVVGMAWVALVPRVPRPGAVDRLSADIQTVFVQPERRGHGIGSALVQAASEHAESLGALHVTVHSGRRAVPVYERLGFQSSPQLLLRVPSRP